jgi:hypothetical protein
MSGIHGQMRPSIARLRASILPEFDPSEVPDALAESEDDLENVSEEESEQDSEIEQNAQQIMSEGPESVNEEDLEELRDELQAAREFDQDVEDNIAHAREARPDSMEVWNRLRNQANRISELEADNDILRQRPTDQNLADAVRDVKRPLEQSLEEAGRTDQNLRAHIAEMEKRIATHAQQLARISDLEADKSILETRPTDQDLQNAVDNVRLPLEKQLADASDRHSAMSAQITELQMRVAILEERPTAEYHTDAVSASIQPLQQQLDQHRVAVQSLQKRPTQDHFDHTVSALQNSLQVAKKERRAVEDLYEDLKTEAKSVSTKELHGLRTANRTLEGDLKVHKSRVVALETHLERIETLAQQNAEVDEQLIQELQGLLSNKNQEMLVQRQADRESTMAAEAAFRRAQGDLQREQAETTRLNQQLQITQDDHQKRLQDIRADEDKSHNFWQQEINRREQFIATLRQQEGESARTCLELRRQLETQTKAADAAKEAHFTTVASRQRIIRKYLESDRDRTKVASLLSSVTLGLYTAGVQHRALAKICVGHRDRNTFLEEQCASLNAATTQKQDALKLAEARIQNLEHQVDELGNEKRALGENNTKLQAEVAKLTNQKSVIEAHQKTLETQIGSKDALLQQLQTEKATVVEQHDALKEHQSTLEDTQRNLEKQNSDKDKTLQQLGQEKNSVMKQYAALEEKHSALQKENDTQGKDMQKLDDKYQKLETAHAELQNKHRDVVTTSQQQSEELEAKQRELDSEVESHQADNEISGRWEECAFAAENARLALLTLLYTKLGIAAPENSKVAFEADWEPGMAECTAERIRRCGMIMDHNEQVTTKAVHRMEEHTEFMNKLTQRAEQLKERWSHPCRCATYIQTLEDGNEELSRDAEKLIDGLRNALNKHEEISTDQARQTDYLIGQLEHVTAAYDELQEWIEGKIRDGKVT